MSLSRLNAHDALRPPPAPGLGRGFALAVLAHALLVLALSAGLQWRSQPEQAFEAELWSAVPQAAAPRAALPEEEEKPPEPDAAAAQKQAQEEAREEAQQRAQEQAQRDADIAIAKARKEKEREDEAREQALRDAERKKQERLKREAEALAEKDKAEKARKEVEKAKALAKEQALKQEQAKKSDADTKKADAKREALRQENLRRIQGMAGGVTGGNASSSGTGPAGSTGAAARSSGPSASYAGRVKARIKPNIIYTDSGAGNPVAEVEVQCAPDGTILSRKLVTPSGDEEWNRAVLRAIDKTEVLPRDTDGRAPCPFSIMFKPRD